MKRTLILLALIAGVALCWAAPPDKLPPLVTAPAEARTIAIVGGSVPAAGCSGSYGNQSEVNGGAVGDASSSECIVRQITDACNGNIASISVRMSYFGTSTGHRYEHVLYSDNAGSPGTLLGSIDSTATGDTNGPAWNVGTGSIATGSTTFWAGVCKEGMSSVEYQVTSGGATRSVHHCSSAYSSPPSTWGSGCTADNDYIAYDMEIYVTY